MYVHVFMYGVHVQAAILQSHQLSDLEVHEPSAVGSRRRSSFLFALSQFRDFGFGRRSFGVLVGILPVYREVAGFVNGGWVRVAVVHGSPVHVQVTAAVLGIVLVRH